MRNLTLEEIIEDVRLEAGRSSKVNLGISERPALISVINRVYEKLYADHDWPHLMIERYISLQAGQRYYDPPVDMDFERILRTEVKFGGSWQPIHRGITRDNLDASDSSLGTVREDPIRRWEIILPQSSAREQIEVWPLPATNGVNDFYLKGIKKFTKLVEDDDRCLLDNNVIALSAAGELLARTNKQDAAIKLREAKDINDTLKKRGMNQFPNRVNRNACHDPYGGNGGRTRQTASELEVSKQRN